MSDPLTILLTGRTGNGKSSTGNSILGRKTFIPRGSSAAITVDIRADNCMVNGRMVTVVDGPGIGDTACGNEEETKSLLDQVNTALGLGHGSVDGFVMVLKYGVRFTKQEKDAVDQFRKIFGEESLRRYGIILMTHGDNFELDMEDDDAMSFEDWCNEQTGDVAKLFEECRNRCVLFNNKSKDNSQLEDQKAHLFEVLNKIKSASLQPYTEQDFTDAEHGRNKIVIAGKLPRLQTETKIIVDRIYSHLDKFSNLQTTNFDSILSELQGYKSEISRHKTYLENEDKQTKVLAHLLTEVSVLESSVGTKIELISSKKRQKERGENQSLRGAKYDSRGGYVRLPTEENDGDDGEGMRRGGGYSGRDENSLTERVVAHFWALTARVKHACILAVNYLWAGIRWSRLWLYNGGYKYVFWGLLGVVSVYGVYALFQNLYGGHGKIDPPIPTSTPMTTTTIQIPGNLTITGSDSDSTLRET